MLGAFTFKIREALGVSYDTEDVTLPKPTPADTIADLEALAPNVILQYTDDSESHKVSSAADPPNRETAVS